MIQGVWHFLDSLTLLSFSYLIAAYHQPLTRLKGTNDVDSEVQKKKAPSVKLDQDSVAIIDEDFRFGFIGNCMTFTFKVTTSSPIPHIKFDHSEIM